MRLRRGVCRRADQFQTFPKKSLDRGSLFDIVNELEARVESNIFGWVAQLVEQGTENPRVRGSIPFPATRIDAGRRPKPPACFLLLRSVFRRREIACPETLPSWVAPSFAHNPTFDNPTFAKHTSCKELSPFLPPIPYKRCVLVDAPPVSAANPLQEVGSGGQEAGSGGHAARFCRRILARGGFWRAPPPYAPRRFPRGQERWDPANDAAPTPSGTRSRSACGCADPAWRGSS